MNDNVTQEQKLELLKKLTGGVEDALKDYLKEYNELADDNGNGVTLASIDEMYCQAGASIIALVMSHVSGQSKFISQDSGDDILGTAIAVKVTSTIIQETIDNIVPHIFGKDLARKIMTNLAAEKLKDITSDKKKSLADEILKPNASAKFSDIMEKVKKAST